MSNNDGGNSGEWAASESKDWKDGRHLRQNRHVLPHAGETRDPRTRKMLTAIHGAYERAYKRGWMEPGEPWPETAQNSEQYDSLQRHHATEGFSKSMGMGDAAGIRHYVGSQEPKPDVSGMKAIGKIDELITGPAPVIVILGKMGDGKSDFAGLLGQRWTDHVADDRLVGSNIRSLEEKSEWVDDGDRARSGWLRSYGELMEWVKQDGDPLENRQRPKLFIGDEFSSSASGRGKQGYETATKMAPLVYKIRKYGGALIYIAHGPKSIHPMLWRVGTIIQKTGRKTATVGQSIKGDKLADIEFSIEGIPPTDWTMATEEASDWSWSAGPEEDAADLDTEAVEAVAAWTVARCKDDGLSHRETARYVPYGKTTVGRVWKDIKNGGDAATMADAVEATIA